MATKPTQSIFPIENGKLTGDLDANNFAIHNLDVANSEGVGTGGGGGGNDTGTTTAILKGDGNHGFADAIAGTDYATSGQVAVKENTADHATDMAAVNSDISTLQTGLVTVSGDVALKADAAATTAALALKADDSALQGYITTNDAAVALKADAAATTTALGFKADTSTVTTALALKEPLLPTTSNDSYILARHNAGAGSAWFFVDPVTLGTTSQSFTDGQSFTNTNYDSATAIFVAGDVGLTITGTDIPAGTTITSRTSATRVVLSQATTGTHTGNSFTIINRLLTTNAGTVTNFGISNSVTDLFTASVANSTTSPVLTLAPVVTTGANTFFGNGTSFTGQAAFMSAGVARTSLGGTTVGQAMFQLANPGVVTWPRINADNSVTARTAAQTLVDLGAETTLNFNAPLTRAGSTVSIPAATAGFSGYLTSADWATFNSKASGTRAINTTAPLQGGGNLTADRTLFMPAATAAQDGYLPASDFANFTAKPPNSRTIGVTAPLSVSGAGSPGTGGTVNLSANLSVSIPKATPVADGYLAASDFSQFASGSGIAVIAGQGSPTGTLTISPSAFPPISKVILNVVLAQPLSIILPPAVNYGSNLGFPGIEIIDQTGGASVNFPITVTRSGSDTIDTVNSIVLARGSAYQRYVSNGGSPGKWFSIRYFVDSFKDPVDVTRQARVSVSSIDPNTTRNINVPNADSVTVIPGPSSPLAGSVVRSISGAGVITASPITSTEIVPTETTVGDINSTVSAAGSVDTVKLNVALTGQRTYIFPPANVYSSGEVLRFYDSTGSITQTNLARVIGPSGTTFNGNVSVDITEPFFNRILVADPVNNNWTVSTFGGTTGSGLTIDPWHFAAVGGGLASISCNAGVSENHHIVLMSGPVILTMGGSIQDGTTGRIKFRDSVGGNVVTVPAGQGHTPGAGGTGVFTTSSTGPIEDEYGWDYDGQYFNFFPLGKNFIGTAPAFSTIGDDTATALTSDGVVKQGNTAASKFVGARLVADGGVTNGATYTIGKVTVYLTKNGTGGNTNMTLSAWSDSGTNSPSTQVANSANVAVGSWTDTAVDFVLNFNATGARTVTSVATTTNNININCTGGQFLQSDVGCKPVGANFPAGARIATVALDGNSATLSTTNGATATGVIAGTANVSIRHIYWLALTGDAGVASGTNYISWHYHLATADGGGRYWNKTVSGSWQIGGITPGTLQLKYITYK